MERISSRPERDRQALPRARARAGGAPSGEVLLDGAHLVQEALATRRPDRRGGLCRTRSRRRALAAGALAHELASRGGARRDRHRSGPRRDQPRRSPVGHRRHRACTAVHNGGCIFCSGTTPSIGATPPLVLIWRGAGPGQRRRDRAAAAAGGATGVVAVDGIRGSIRVEGAARRDGRHVPSAGRRPRRRWLT